MERYVGKRVLVGLVMALLVLAFGVSVALAKSGPGQVKAPLYSDPTGACPPPIGKVYGEATLIRVKGVVTIRVKLHGAEPGKYILELGVPSDPGECDAASPGVVNLFSVDSSGDGEGTATFDPIVIGQRFHVGVFNVDTEEDAYVTPLLKIGSA